MFPALRSDGGFTTRSLDELLDSGAALFDLMACKIARATKHRRPASKVSVAKRMELRSHAASVLVTRFRKELRRPYFGQVAIIAHLLSGVETDSEYVKKIEQMRRSTARG